ncbi:putative short-chain dehydrogenase [Mycena kentingensis (nom. inval.)]|nr:putative short-chain dehydrogenase [Mycena kentingensis (nom. inval.)]
MEAVLVVGSTGNIGIAAILAALRSKRQVIAIVRNKAAAEKVYKHAGTKENITCVEADVSRIDGVAGVVEKVKAGELPAFQHVYAAVGMIPSPAGIHEVDMKSFEEAMNISFYADYYAYRATYQYLVEQGPNSSFTICTGGGGDTGKYGATSIAQGALFSFAAVVASEKIPIRFNEVYLCCRVEYDSQCEGAENAWKLRASDFGRVYEALLANADIRDSRVTVKGLADVNELKYQKKLAGFE